MRRRRSFGRRSFRRISRRVFRGRRRSPGRGHRIGFRM